VTGFLDYPLWLIFLVSLAVVLGCGEIGRRIGARVGGAKGGGDATLESALLGLLALMIGFTFAMGMSRADARREALLNEANAIGTTALRARLLPAPHDAESLKLLREYVQLRLDVGRHSPSPEELAAALTRSNAIQEALWRQAMAVAAKDNGMVPTGVFIQALNGMIDSQQERLVPTYNHLPNFVLVVLYGVAAIAAGFSGYGRALRQERSMVPVFTVGALVCIMILLIQDLDRPRSGFITIDQQPMIDTADALASYDAAATGESP
jgi:hypothetical protein